MEKVGPDRLIALAKQFNEEKAPWHHHFLTPRCILNQNPQFRIILENESTGKAFYSQFEKKPIEELKQLENLFFNRN